MLYTVHNTINNFYCQFDPDKNIVSRWKPYLEEVSLEDGYPISIMWKNIHKKSHEELLDYFSKHKLYRLITNLTYTYEFW